MLNRMYSVSHEFHYNLVRLIDGLTTNLHADCIYNHNYPYFRCIDEAAIGSDFFFCARPVRLFPTITLDIHPDRTAFRGVAAMPILHDKLEEALESRRKRHIQRRLPEPNTPFSATSPVDFCSNDYLSLSIYAPLRTRFLERINVSEHVLGSGGSRLLVNPTHHQELEDRLRRFFFEDVAHVHQPGAALLFNSGFDANAGLFACLPQKGDVVIIDEYIHASVHDGVRSSRAASSCFKFAHNDTKALRNLLLRITNEQPDVAQGKSSVIIAVETLYSMDGTFAPLLDIVKLIEELLPSGNGHLIVDEAHATGLYGSQGRGLVAHYQLENKVLARLVTFGKALASSGGMHSSY